MNVARGYGGWLCLALAVLRQAQWDVKHAEFEWQKRDAADSLKRKENSI